jgi:hemolysin
VSLENGNLKVGPVTLSGHADSQYLQAGIEEAR